MNPLSPAGIFALLATEIPAQQRDNMIVIGSLAAAYHFLGEDEGHRRRLSRPGARGMAGGG